jgi:hypothetical protein
LAEYAIAIRPPRTARKDQELREMTRDLDLFKADVISRTETGHPVIRLCIGRLLRYIVHKQAQRLKKRYANAA